MLCSSFFADINDSKTCTDWSKKEKNALVDHLFVCTKRRCTAGSCCIFVIQGKTKDDTQKLRKVLHRNCLVWDGEALG